MPATTAYPKPYGLQKMIDAHDDLMASQLTLIEQNPYMNMAAVLTRMARQDARRMPTLFGQKGQDRYAWEAFNSLFTPTLSEGGAAKTP